MASLLSPSRHSLSFAATLGLHLVTIGSLFHWSHARITAPIAPVMVTFIDSISEQQTALRTNAKPTAKPKTPVAPVKPEAVSEAPTVPTAPSAPTTETTTNEAPAASDTPAPPASITLPRFNADYLKNPPPVYPVASRRAGETGRVLLRVVVRADGSPADVTINQTSGSARLDHAALQAVRQWRFIPARRGDTAVEAPVLVPISFTLES